ncbi:hypothetical protein [Treponema succinifaciens]|uniref:hypothetical protein n=1 Tax=Treponema succinifaciens TaxID=167 RepID=UPI0023F49230|nr:hypothetical protein [Treponema succinifaciens]
MKKLIFSILPAFLFAFISCMNMSSGSGENGSVRVALPGNGRATYTYSKNNAGKFIVRLYNDDFDQTEEGTVGGGNRVWRPGAGKIHCHSGSLEPRRKHP